jgi:hypothetical protein
MVLPSSRPVTEGAYSIVDFEQGHLRNPDTGVSDTALDVRPNKQRVRAHLEDSPCVWTEDDVPFPEFSAFGGYSSFDARIASPSGHFVFGRIHFHFGKGIPFIYCPMGRCNQRITLTEFWILHCSPGHTAIGYSRAFITDASMQYGAFCSHWLPSSSGAVAGSMLKKILEMPFEYPLNASFYVWWAL